MYLAFVDESGDPGLLRPNPEYPIFALAAVVCLEREYSSRIEPQRSSGSLRGRSPVP